ncbi:hypothetical protein [Sporolactobacillus laevolacticus]|uniref:Uncharacterized protein n=1 Tax=Sporolactobacillus laevolacticus DSM 442 TaxID=1395513 RepID=V6IZM7_9BACL|nr:hypothetical protein [Sporolactobacillus laevolacticus]EST12977.1 hypothetical protein P343_04490 [Sporolactobacillus laevolacticus DSM 442]
MNDSFSQLGDHQFPNPDLADRADCYEALMNFRAKLTRKKVTAVEAVETE